MDEKVSYGASALSDEEVVQKILDGETSLYEKLMRKYNLRLFRISKSIVHSDEDAEDVMQNTYVNAYIHLGGFKKEAQFSTWLIRILINESMLCKKRIARRNEATLESQDAVSYSNVTPLNTLMNSELKYVLEKAVSDLPEKYRVVFVMREIEGMTTNDTMEALGLTESNVKIRLTRAKEALRDNLGAYYKSEQVYAFHLTRCDRIVANVMGRIV
jgi:RNA polymerase sigma factor (sigma-70 family)